LSLQYRIAQILISTIAKILFRWKVYGRENLPEGSVLIASNHLSNYDPPLLGTAIRRASYYFAKIELFRNRYIGAFLKSVNAFPARRGEADLDAWRTARNVLKRGDILIFFPEGTRSLDGEVQPHKPGMGHLADATNAPVVPTAITGSNQPKDVFWGRAKLRVGFGKPISITDFSDEPDKHERMEKFSLAVMAEIKRLKAELELT
jgi:1-acyl-sn-glycerol-3-phosphate acyltransferase